MSFLHDCKSCSDFCFISWFTDSTLLSASYPTPRLPVHFRLSFCPTFLIVQNHFFPFTHSAFSFSWLYDCSFWNLCFRLFYWHFNGPWNWKGQSLSVCLSPGSPKTIYWAYPFLNEMHLHCIDHSELCKVLLFFYQGTVPIPTERGKLIYW